MKIILIVTAWVLMLYVFNILTGSLSYVYNGSSLDVNSILTFSYIDATKVAESIH